MAEKSYKPLQFEILAIFSVKLWLRMSVHGQIKQVQRSQLSFCLTPSANSRRSIPDFNQTYLEFEKLGKV
jgi:hypothetical protein